LFSNELVRREASKGLQPTTEVVSAYEVGEVTSLLIVVVVVEPVHGRILDRPVHAFDLAIGTRKFDFGRPVVVIRQSAGMFEGMRAKTFHGGDGRFEQ